MVGALSKFLACLDSLECEPSGFSGYSLLGQNPRHKVSFTAIQDLVHVQDFFSSKPSTRLMLSPTDKIRLTGIDSFEDNFKNEFRFWQRLRVMRQQSYTSAEVLCQLKCSHRGSWSKRWLGSVN